MALDASFVTTRELCGSRTVAAEVIWHHVTTAKFAYEIGNIWVLCIGNQSNSSYEGVVDISSKLSLTIDFELLASRNTRMLKTY